MEVVYLLPRLLLSRVQMLTDDLCHGLIISGPDELQCLPVDGVDLGGLPGLEADGGERIFRDPQGQVLVLLLQGGRQPFQHLPALYQACASLPRALSFRARLSRAQTFFLRALSSYALGLEMTFTGLKIT